MASTHRKQRAVALAEIMVSDDSSLSLDSETDDNSNLDADSLDENYANNSSSKLDYEVETDTESADLSSWTTKYNASSRDSIPFIDTPDLTFHLGDDAEEIGSLRMFIADELIDITIQKTNGYAEQYTSTNIH